MSYDGPGFRSARTVLEQKIRERRQTFEEFAEYAGEFAREHDEPGTLSVRHLLRLAAGRQANGSPLGPVRPATARLLERIFDTSIDELLSNPRQENSAHVLRVAVAVVVKENHVLMVCRRNNDGGISWQFPAGIVKPGIAPEVVAVRETLAETGIRCIIKRKLGNRLHPITNVFCEYLFCEYLTGKIRNLDVAENADAIWVEKARLTQLIPGDEIYPPIINALAVDGTG